MSLLFFQTESRIAAMAIGAAEHDVGCLMHRLDAFVALIAADAFGIGLSLRLVDPVLRWSRHGLCDREILGQGDGWAVAGGGRFVLREKVGRYECKEEVTSNVERPTFNVH